MKTKLKLSLVLFFLCICIAVLSGQESNDKIKELSANDYQEVKSNAKPMLEKTSEQTSTYYNTITSLRDSEIETNKEDNVPVYKEVEENYRKRNTGTNKMNNSVIKSGTTDKNIPDTIVSNQRFHSTDSKKQKI